VRRARRQKGTKAERSGQAQLQHSLGKSATLRGVMRPRVVCRYLLCLAVGRVSRGRTIRGLWKRSC
jgi:hypothetical protein